MKVETAVLVILGVAVVGLGFYAVTKMTEPAALAAPAAPAPAPKPEASDPISVVADGLSSIARLFV